MSSTVFSLVLAALSGIVLWRALRGYSVVGGRSRAGTVRSLTELEARARALDTPDAHLDLADALEAGEHAVEADAIYSAVLRHDPSSLRALHGRARALLSLARPDKAVDCLEQVLVVDRTYGGYAAALDYAEALWQCGRLEETLELLAAMVEATGRMNHRVAHAHYLAAADQRGRAREVLTAALERFATSSFIERKRERAWAVRAEHMLEELTG